MATSAKSNKYLGVLTPLIIAEKERDSFFRRQGPFSLHMRCSLFLSESTGCFLHIFNNYF